jgi:NAD(P)H-dependent FMN reductase
MRLAQACKKIVIESRTKNVNIINASEVKNKDIIESDLQIWVVPEWNGSFPYVFKRIIDDSEYPSHFDGKEIMLIGTSESTFGNLIGITHLEHILQWVGARVFEKRVCFPNMSSMLNANEHAFRDDDRLVSAIEKFIC